MKKEKYNPFFIGTWIKDKNTIIVRSVDHSVTLQGMTVKSISEIIQLCSGENPLEQVLLKLQLTYSKKDIAQIFKIFTEKGIIVNAYDMSSFVTKITRNPLAFSPIISKKETEEYMVNLKRNLRSKSGVPVHQTPLIKKDTFLNLLNKRKSCREFTGEGLSFSLLKKILWAGYGVQKTQDISQLFLHRTTPSAGARYPIHLSLVLLKDCKELKRGIYTVHFTDNGGIQFIVKKDFLVSVPIAFLGASSLQNACGIITINASYADSSFKYGNKAIRHVLLEAGCVSQNINIACQENSVGSYDFAGFHDELVSYIIQTDEQVTPLHSIVFGIPSKHSLSLTNISQDIETRVILPGKDDILNLPYFSVFGRNSLEKNSIWSSGKDNNLNTAIQKMQSEILEWSSWDLPKESKRILSFKPSDVDPSTFLKPELYHPLQYGEKKFSFEKFNIQENYNWVLGTSLNSNSSDKYIVTENIFFSSSLPAGKKMCTTTTSSGCAAHLTKNDAVETAISELIERDAFMITWINKIEHPNINKKRLSGSIQKRISTIQLLGYEVVIKNITVGIAPVIMVCARSHSNLKIIVGTSFSLDFNNALNSALSEVEVSLLNHLDKNKKEHCALKPTQVNTLSDHEKLHNQKKYFYESNFLFKNKKLDDRKYDYEYYPKNYSLIDKISELGFTAYVIDGFLPSITTNDFLDQRHVVRVIIPDLVPLSYGYRNEPMNISRLYGNKSEKNFIAPTSEYKKKNRFPHPFN